jgi:phosphohistidine phosphatase SixA
MSPSAALRPRPPCLALLLALAAGSLPLSPPAGAQEEAARGQSVIFLVRHAEKVDDSRDPELSEAGKARATELARILEDAGIERVLSTDYIRTRDTAAPVAEALGLEVELYDPRDLPGAAAEILGRGGRVLVVGHSNTTPAMVSALGGDSGLTMEDSDYDHLYVVTPREAGTATTVLIRFGAR